MCRDSPKGIFYMPNNYTPFIIRIIKYCNKLLQYYRRNRLQLRNKLLRNYRISKLQLSNNLLDNYPQQQILFRNNLLRKFLGDIIY